MYVFANCRTKITINKIGLNLLKFVLDVHGGVPKLWIISNRGL